MVQLEWSEQKGDSGGVRAMWGRTVLLQLLQALLEARGLRRRWLRWRRGLRRRWRVV